MRQGDPEKVKKFTKLQKGLGVGRFVSQDRPWGKKEDSR